MKNLIFILAIVLCLVGCGESGTAGSDLPVGSVGKDLSGPFPQKITSIVSGEYHVDDGGSGEDMIWLEKYSEATFYISSSKYDSYGIEEGKSITVSVSPGDVSKCGDSEPCFEIH